MAGGNSLFPTSDHPSDVDLSPGTPMYEAGHGAPKFARIDADEEQTQILRLPLAQEMRQADLRMTTHHGEQGRKAPAPTNLSF